MEHISIGKLCKFLDISLFTVYRWIKSGKILPDFITFGGHRRFLISNIKKQFLPHLPQNNTSVLCYARVSTHDQKKNLLTQSEKLNHYAKISFPNQNIIHINELGSGLNYKKKGLHKLIDLILSQQINTLIINHKYILLRFGSEIIFKLCQHNNIQVVIIEDSQIKSFEQELAFDVIEVMAVFCAKLYGKQPIELSLIFLKQIRLYLF